MQLDQTLLNAYLDNELGQSERDWVEQQLATSPEAQLLLKQLRAEATQLQQGLDALTPTSEQQSPAWLALKRVQPHLTSTRLAANGKVEEGDATSAIWESPTLFTEIKSSFRNFRWRRMDIMLKNSPIVIGFGLIIITAMTIALWLNFDLTRPLQLIANVTMSADSAETPAQAVTDIAELPTDTIPVSVVFNNEIELVGYKLLKGAETAGDAVNVQLYWRGLKPIETDYTVFMQLTDSNEQILAQFDGPPFPGSTWLPQTTREGNYTLSDLALKTDYNLRVGLYNSSTNERLLASVDGRQVGDYYDLPLTPIASEKPQLPLVQQSEISTTKVVVALQPIAQGQEFSPGSIGRRDWPTNNLPPNYISNEATIIGRVAKQEIVQGQVIVQDMLVEAGGPRARITPTRIPGWAYPAGQPVTTTEVIVALQPIAEGQEFTPDLIGRHDWPKDNLVPPVPGHITDEVEVIGKAAGINIHPGRIIIQDMLVEAKPRDVITTTVIFDDDIELSGYKFFTSTVAAGDALRLKTYWRSEPADAWNNITFIQLVDSQGKIMAASQSPLRSLPDASAPLQSSRNIEVSHILPLDEKLSPGEYDLLIGISNTAQNLRLPIYPDVHQAQNTIVLTSVKVTAPLEPSPARSTSPGGLEITETEIVMVLDLSGSMAAEDFVPNRLGAAKTAMNVFIDQQPPVGNRLGLVTFATNVIGQIQPTLDYTMLQGALNSTQLSWDIGLDSGTAIGIGLQAAVDLLGASQSDHKVIILLTDGANNSGQIEPMTAAQAASDNEIRVYTVALVGQGPARIVYPDGRIEHRTFEIDEEMLGEIAEDTGGMYFSAVNTSELQTIYERIIELEAGE